MLLKVNRADWIQEAAAEGQHVKSAASCSQSSKYIQRRMSQVFWQGTRNYTTKAVV